MNEITVDRETLKALGAETRIAILKNLARRRMTQAELASELGIKPPSVNEHIRSLQSVGLVVQVSTDKKWKYYELTQKGKALLEPSKTRVWLLLSFSALLFLFSAFDLHSKLFPTTPSIVSSAAFGVSEVLSISDQAPLLQKTASTVALSLPAVELTAFLFSLLLLGVGIGLLLKKD